MSCTLSSRRVAVTTIVSTAIGCDCSCAVAAKLEASVVA
jgi:hypothetical protein